MARENAPTARASLGLLLASLAADRDAAQATAERMRTDDGRMYQLGRRDALAEAMRAVDTLINAIDRGAVR